MQTYINVLNMVSKTEHKLLSAHITGTKVIRILSITKSRQAMPRSILSTEFNKIL